MGESEGMQQADGKPVARWDFFISYTQTNRDWAEWVAWQLEEDGYRVLIQAWDFVPGSNWQTGMQQGVDDADRTLALLSPEYLRSVFGQQEWQAAQASDPLGFARKLVPIRVAECERPGILGQIVSIDLFGLEEVTARRYLLDQVEALRVGRAKPGYTPGFPGAVPNLVAPWAGQLHGIGSSAPRLPGSLPRVWNLPGRNAGFVGRDALLVHLHRALTNESRVAVQALGGRGGVGKTQLAIEYGHRFAGEYELAWWIPSEEPAAISERLAALAVKIGIATMDTPSADACEVLAEELRTRDRWLLIFDNAESPREVAPYLPGGKGHVLITSRNTRWQDHAVPLDVDTFARNESVDLLCARVQGLPPIKADQLAEALEDLPLALLQAAAIVAGGVTLSQYLILLQENIGAVLDEGRPDTYPVSLAAQVRLSVKRLADTNPQALLLLRACALLAPEPFPLHACTPLKSNFPQSDFPRALVQLLVSPLQCGRALGALARQGLARVQDGTLQLHRLTQELVRDQLTDTERADAASAAEGLLAAALPGDAADPAAWPAWAELRAHLLILDAEDLTTNRARYAATQACWYLIVRGDASTALPRLQYLHQAWKRALGLDDEHTLRVGSHLAQACHDTLDYIRARELDEDTLARRRRVLGKDDPETLRSASNLALRLAEVGELRAARELEEDTLVRKARKLGPDHPSTLGTASNLALHLAELGEIRDACELEKDTLARQQRVLGIDHPDALHTASNLALRLAELNEMDAARELEKDTLARKRQVLGEDHPSTLHTASNLALHLAEVGESEAARELEEDTLTRQRRVLGQNHPDTQRTALIRARRLARLGRPAQIQQRPLQHEDPPRAQATYDAYGSRSSRGIGDSSG